MKPLNELGEIITGLTKVLSGLYKANIDDDIKQVLMIRLITGINVLVGDAIQLGNDDVEKSIDEVLAKIEKIMPFIRENKHNENVKRLGDDLQIIYDELVTDKNRLKIFKKD